MVARSRGPCYSISDLVKDCSTPGKVIVRTKARENAKYYFHFDTDSRIIDFVSTGGFEEIKHESTGELDLALTKGSFLMHTYSGLDLNPFILPSTKGKMANGSLNHFIPLKSVTKHLHFLIPRSRFWKD